MTARVLDLQVLRKGHPWDTFQGEGDPEDPMWLRERLRGWLRARGWDEKLWGQFEIIARDRGRAKPIAKVPAV